MVGALVLLLGLLGLRLSLQAQEQAWRLRTQTAVSLEADQFMGLIDRAVRLAQSVTKLEPPTLDDEQRFQAQAGQLATLAGAGMVAQWAPNGVVRRIAPLKGHEAAIGHDLLNDPKRRDDVRRAIGERSGMWSGPFPLVQGGLGLVYRWPSFDAIGNFTGLGIALMSFPEVLEQGRVQRSDELGVDVAFSIAMGTQVDKMVKLRQTKNWQDQSSALSLSEWWAIDKSGDVRVAALGRSPWTRQEDTSQRGQELWLQVRAQGQPTQGLAWWVQRIGVLGLLPLLLGIGAGALTRTVRERNLRRTREAALAQMEQIMSHSMVAKLTFDQQGRCLWANENAKRLLKIDQAASADKAYFDDEIWQRRGWSDMARQVLQDGQRRVLEFAGLEPEGGHLDIRLTWDRLKPIGGDVVLLQALDLSQEHQREAQLIESREQALAGIRAKNEFLATLSHELLTPLNGMMGGLQLLQRAGLSAKADSYLEMTRESSESMLALVNDLLDFNKVDTGELIVNPGPTRLDRSLAAMKTNCEAYPRQAGVDLLFECDPMLSQPLMVDEGHLVRALKGLVSNALKFTHQGQVKVQARVTSCQDHEWQLVLSVSDTGIGMSKATQATLFQPLTQGDGSLTRAYGGLGLGLSFCKRLIEALDGQIQVESEEGVGSVFTVSLALAPAPQPSFGAIEPQTPLDVPAGQALSGRHGQLVAATDAQGEPLAGRAVMMVNNPAVDNLVVKVMLESLGARVTTASDESEALRRLRDQGERADLVLIELSDSMAQDTQLVRELRGSDEPRLQSMPVVALAEHVDQAVQEQCLQAGLSEVLAKPVSSRKLVAICEHMTT